MGEDQLDQPFYITPKESLVSAKEKLGGFEKKEITAPTWAEAHRELGEWVGEQVQSILTRKVEGSSDEDLQKAMVFASGCKDHLEAKRTHPLIGQGVQKYLDSLDAWAEGAGLDDIAKSVAQRVGSPISRTELALWLQNDNVGCQTTLIRNKEGTVSFIHSEEDIGGAVERPRQAAFTIGKEKKQRLNAFIYPHLLPGPAFSWGNDIFQAVDFLYLKAPEAPGGLANTAAWLLFTQENPYDNAEDIIKALGPFVDGYAVNMVRRRQEGEPKVDAKRIVFAQDAMSVKELSGQTGDVMAQVNVLAEEENEDLQKLEEIDPSKRPLYERRVERTKRALKLIQHFVKQELNLDALTRIMAFRIGEKGFAYANTDVKAGVAGEISGDKMQMRILSGPAIKEDLKAGKYEEISIPS